MSAAVNSNPRRPASPPPAQSGVGVPVLWHLKVSNYNEKARWALDYKRVAHVRRAVVPGRHRRVAERLSGGRTLPVLVLDGEALGDSTRIIETLERRHPQPPLYPRDPIERQRALELEDYFDEELGPCCRLLFLDQALPDTRLMLGAFAPDLTGVPLLAARARFPLMRRRIRTQFAISAASVARAYDTLQAAGERFRTALAGVGDEILHLRPLRRRDQRAEIDAKPLIQSVHAGKRTMDIDGLIVSGFAQKTNDALRFSKGIRADEMRALRKLRD